MHDGWSRAEKSADLDISEVDSAPALLKGALKQINVTFLSCASVTAHPIATTATGGCATRPPLAHMGATAIARALTSCAVAVHYFAGAATRPAGDPFAHFTTWHRPRDAIALRNVAAHVA